jgi:energy-coupling factor transporter transmembrane protein EcfT
VSDKEGRAVGRTHASPSFWLGLFAVLVLSVCVCDLRRGAVVALLATLSAAAAVVARVRPSLLLLYLLPLLSFGVVMLAVILVLPAPAEAETVTLLGRRVPEQSIRFLSAVLLKSALLLPLATAFSVKLTERDVLVGLTGWRLPAKVVTVSYLILRSLHTVRAEVVRLINARDARGKPGGIRAVTVAGAISQVLLVRLARRAETQAFALCARGYDGYLAVADDTAPSRLELLGLGALALGLLWLTVL